MEMIISSSTKYRLMWYIKQLLYYLLFYTAYQNCVYLTYTLKFLGCTETLPFLFPSIFLSFVTKAKVYSQQFTFSFSLKKKRKNIFLFNILRATISYN